MMRKALLGPIHWFKPLLLYVFPRNTNFYEIVEALTYSCSTYFNMDLPPQFQHFIEQCAPFRGIIKSDQLSLVYVQAS